MYLHLIIIFFSFLLYTLSTILFILNFIFKFLLQRSVVADARSLVLCVEKLKYSLEDGYVVVYVAFDKINFASE